MLFLLAGKYTYMPAKVLEVRDWPDSEDTYKIEYGDRSGRKPTPTVGRRYLKRP